MVSKENENRKQAAAPGLLLDHILEEELRVSAWWLSRESDKEALGVMTCSSRAGKRGRQESHHHTWVTSLRTCQKGRGLNCVCLGEEDSNRPGLSEDSSPPWVLRRLFVVGQAGVRSGGGSG